MVGKKPDKKPHGRDGPPTGYPKDKSIYADPENWKYPLHTSWHAKAARRYFDDPLNREKYSEDERAYIDWRINKALNKFHKTLTKASTRTTPSRRRNTSSVPLEENLLAFMDAGRIQRGVEIDDSLVTIEESTPEMLRARVKDYIVQIDMANKIILHDCEDWRKHIGAKKMCKHFAKLLTVIDYSSAKQLLERITSEKDRWNFTASGAT